MIINAYGVAALSEAFGIDMAAIDIGSAGHLGVGAAWGRVAQGSHSHPDQHDEIETFVIVAGQGEVIVDGKRRPVVPGTVVQFEPFETHVLENTGVTDLVFATFYWRDLARASASASTPARRFSERPVFVFSTPPTPNGDLHLGHLAGPYLAADAFVRFQRMNGTRAWHLTGSDDFQSYVLGAARAEGRDPADIAANYGAEIAETLRLMDIEVDEFTVTNGNPTYSQGLRAFFSQLVASGWVSPREDPALFDAASGDYLYEVDVVGGCPTCGELTGGNICEECGEPNLCADLSAPQNRRSGSPIRLGTARRFSLPLHEHRKVIAQHHHLGRVPARLKELAERIFTRHRFDLPITHPAPWGVSPAESDVDGQVIWAWPEMAYGFLHGIQELGKRLGEGWRANQPAEDWKIVHFFGYDNSFYHAVLYPVLYKLAFPKWAPDIDYHVNDFYLLEGSKFSTSRRHAVWGKEILGPETVDAVRYYLSRSRPEGRRTNFERAAYDSVVTDMLAGRWQQWLVDLGRRVSRDHGGKAPEAGIWTPEHTAFYARLTARLAAVSTSLGQDGFSLNEATAELDGIVADAQRFTRDQCGAAEISEWKDERRTEVALELAAARLLAWCAAPVMPRFARRLASALGLPEPLTWPRTPELVPAGTPVALAEQAFFDPSKNGKEVHA